MRPSVIFFLGPQGSGKGTQAKILATKLDFFYLEMGGILREERNRQTRQGVLGELIDHGVLLPDDLIWEIVSARIDAIPLEKGIIFDGVPRSLSQAQILIDYLRGHHRFQMATIFLDVPREESVKRLLLRAQTEGRPDDTMETIQHRLKLYEEVTLPVVSFLRQETTLFDIDGAPSISEVEQAINLALDTVLYEQVL